MSDAQQIVAQVKAARKVRRRRPTRRVSCLQPFLGELIALRQAKASFGDLQFWLRTEKKVVVWRSTVQRFLQANAPDLA